MYFKAFLVGLAIPAILLPFVLYGGVWIGKPELLNVIVLHFLPLVWGIWNIFFLLFFQWLKPGNVNASYFLMGGLLGLFLAIYGVFGLNLPGLVDVHPPLSYLPLLFVPILYALLWRGFIKPLNQAIVFPPETPEPLPPSNSTEIL